MKKKVFKGFLMLLSVICLLSGPVTTAFASEVQPRFAYINSLSGAMSYAGQQYSVTVRGITSTTKISVSATLYRKEWYGYAEIDTLTGSSNNDSCTPSKSFAFEQGKSYKLEISATVSCGSNSETQSKTVTASF